VLLLEVVTGSDATLTVAKRRWQKTSDLSIFFIDHLMLIPSKLDVCLFEDDDPLRCNLAAAAIGSRKIC
jgi:hypothetical protein